MHVRFWGTRGSIPKSGAHVLRYGGSTACVEVCTAAGTLLVIDCGSGAHGLGQELASQGRGRSGHLLIPARDETDPSRPHWDQSGSPRWRGSVPDGSMFSRAGITPRFQEVTPSELHDFTQF